jgi:23S rRNA pseudouridine2605 synthase
MENRKAAGKPLRKNEKPGADNNKFRKVAGKPAVRSEKSGSKANESTITLIRLNRFISNSGVCSRRDADEHIKNGLISVNGEVVTDMGTKVTYDDDVRFKNKRLSAEKKVYILLNKPKDYVTTVEDPHAEHTVLELIGKECTRSDASIKQQQGYFF